MKSKLVFSNGYYADIICRGWGVTMFHYGSEQDALKELNEFKRLCNKNGRSVIIEGQDFFSFSGPYSNGVPGNICTYAVMNA